MNQHVATGRKPHTVYRINEITVGSFLLLVMFAQCSHLFTGAVARVNHSGQVEIKTTELAFSEQLCRKNANTKKRCN